MNKSYLINTVILFVIWMIGSFIVHGTLLHGDYQSASALYRSDTDSQQYMHLMLLAHVMLAAALVAIYKRGIDSGKPWLGQGINFALLIICLTIIPTYTIYYVVQPMPGILAIKQIIFESILMIGLGVLLGFLHRNDS